MEHISNWMRDVALGIARHVQCVQHCCYNKDRRIASCVASSVDGSLWSNICIVVVVGVEDKYFGHICQHESAGNLWARSPTGMHTFEVAFSFR